MRRRGKQNDKTGESTYNFCFIIFFLQNLKKIRNLIEKSEQGKRQLELGIFWSENLFLKFRKFQFLK